MKKLSKKLLALLLVFAMLIPTGALMVTTSAVDISIPEDAVEFNGHYYKVYQPNLNWLEAKEFCENLGGHLATVSSAEENKFLLELVNNIDARNFMIGYSDYEKEGVWQWVTDEKITYTNWGKRQPDNNDSKGQDFAAIVRPNTSWCSAGQWDDIEAFSSKGYYFICEWEPNIYNLGEETYGFRNYKTYEY